MAVDTQIKSKERVRNYGEVYTDPREVNAMIDLVWGEEPGIASIDSTWLEPACGDGNFLVEIFHRKLALCQTPEDGLRALRSMFGVDILPDNVEETKARLHRMFVQAFPKSSALTGWNAALILKQNIRCGDSLTCREMDGTPIWFLAEYTEPEQMSLFKGDA